MKTQKIAGHSITLKSGQSYLASRPMARHGREVYPVSIRCLVSSGDTVPGTLERSEPDIVINDLSYEEANALLAAFNNGVSSFSGRVW